MESPTYCYSFSPEPGIFVACLEHSLKKMLESQVDLTLFEIISAIILNAQENGIKQLM